MAFIVVFSDRYLSSGAVENPTARKRQLRPLPPAISACNSARPVFGLVGCDLGRRARAACHTASGGGIGLGRHRRGRRIASRQRSRQAGSGPIEEPRDLAETIDHRL